MSVDVAKARTELEWAQNMANYESWAQMHGRALCNEIDALRARLAAAEARADELDEELTDREEEVDELIQRCERLAAYVRADKAYWDWWHGPRNGEMGYGLVEAWRTAKAAIAGDLGGEGEP